MLAFYDELELQSQLEALYGDPQALIRHYEEQRPDRVSATLLEYAQSSACGLNASNGGGGGGRGAAAAAGGGGVVDDGASAKSVAQKATALTTVASASAQQRPLPPCRYGTLCYRTSNTAHCAEYSHNDQEIENQADPDTRTICNSSGDPEESGVTTAAATASPLTSATTSPLASASAEVFKLPSSPCPYLFDIVGSVAGHNMPQYVVCDGPAISHTALHVFICVLLIRVMIKWYVRH